MTFSRSFLPAAVSAIVALACGSAAVAQSQQSPADAGDQRTNPYSVTQPQTDFVWSEDEESLEDQQELVADVIDPRLYNPDARVDGRIRNRVDSRINNRIQSRIGRVGSENANATDSIQRAEGRSRIDYSDPDR